MPPEPTVTSPNFAFLAKHDPLLVRYGAMAERNVFTDPNTALIKLRQFGEVLAQLTAAKIGITSTVEDKQNDLLWRLRDAGILQAKVWSIFTALRKIGNAASHAHHDSKSDALHHLKLARELGIWYHRTYTDSKFSAGPFVPPPDPEKASQEVYDELERLRQHAADLQVAASQAHETAAEQARLRAAAEAKNKALYDEINVALELATETEQRAAAEKAQLAEALAVEQAKAQAAPRETIAASIERANKAEELVELDEAATRRLIDDQLADYGWEVDSVNLRYNRGARPQAGRNMAIAEWPTDNGPADYVLFVGLRPLGIVEAKRRNVDVAGSIEQAKRYSRGYRLQDFEEEPGGPWNDYRVPFMFATNGGRYFKQIKTKSGIWFLDGRRPTNLSDALETWYTPEGLLELLKLDHAAADARLKAEPVDLSALRDYQVEAIRAIEDAIIAGRREILVAMATGTGKTKTCIGLVYRLLKYKRFRRILFLVDRTALANQATDAFKEFKLENYQSFTDIYNVKELGEIVPDQETKLHFATVQGMVKRIIYPGDTPPPPADWYDCIVVDECHRGYSLDTEMSAAELEFRNETDYISKYTRVLEHFDAVKIGLTATPALHTTELFGGPERQAVFRYSYRQAVVDGHLVDHELPMRIVTALGEDGIHWKQGEQVKVLDRKTNDTQIFTTPDNIDLEVEHFNRQVVTESFNRVVCEQLAEHIDPRLPGKTLIFCATDDHADLVVDLLKAAFRERYGSVEDDAVLKITGRADKPGQLIRNYRNERLPSVVVTVDLLTTGIDIPSITNLVFIRRVRSRILYEQMLGRATRLCPDLYGPGEHKQHFMIFDAVNLYAALEKYSEMKPVASRPEYSIEDLLEEIAHVSDPSLLPEIKDQLLAKLQRKKRSINAESRESLESMTGMSVEKILETLRKLPARQIADWFTDRPSVAPLLDRVTTEGQRRQYISEKDDVLRRVERGYGNATKPGDFLEAFETFVRANMERIPALLIAAQRPRELTRKQLRELKLALDEAGYSEINLRTAWRESTNADIAASILGHIRRAASGTPLLPYRERVDKALQTILSRRNWTLPQRTWLKRIAKQLEAETIVDHDAMDQGEFAAQGGFQRLNTIFDGQLDAILQDFADAIWQAAA